MKKLFIFLFLCTGLALQTTHAMKRTQDDSRLSLAFQLLLAADQAIEQRTNKPRLETPLESVLAPAAPLSSKIFKSYQCSYAGCTKTYKTTTGVDYHACATHGKPWPYKCSHPGCTHGCLTKNLLITHMDTHKTERRFKCPLCEKSFSVNKSLTIHLISHSGKKPYACTICPKEFTTKRNYNRHLLLHSGETPYACPFPACTEKFSRQDVLALHLKSHGPLPTSNQTIENTVNVSSDSTLRN